MFYLGINVLFRYQCFISVSMAKKYSGKYLLHFGSRSKFHKETDDSTTRNRILLDFIKPGQEVMMMMMMMMMMMIEMVVVVKMVTMISVFKTDTFKGIIRYDVP